LCGEASTRSAPGAETWQPPSADHHEKKRQPSMAAQRARQSSALSSVVRPSPAMLSGEYRSRSDT